MSKLTIFTATYNRAYIISQLYESLLRQTCKDFEWLVIDDGSTDDTEKLFESWTQVADFKINYIRQNENQGLIRTLNLGVKEATGDFLSKVDSDDYVVDDFVEKILSWIDELEKSNKSDVYAVGALRVNERGIPLKGSWPKINGQYVEATDLERAKYDLDADMVEAWSLEILRKYPFTVWKTENFAPEQIVLHQIALDGFKIRWYAEPMVICEYQADGLTKGASKLEKKNPMGYAMMYNQHLKRNDLTFITKVKYAMNFVALCFVGGNPTYILNGNRKGFIFLAALPGFLLSFRRKRQYSKI